MAIYCIAGCILPFIKTNIFQDLSNNFRVRTVLKQAKRASQLPMKCPITRIDSSPHSQPVPLQRLIRSDDLQRYAKLFHPTQRRL